MVISLQGERVTRCKGGKLLMKRLEGKRAFVTGSGRGIGKAIAAKLAEAGAVVAIADIDAANAEATAEEIPNAVAVPVDVSDRKAVHAAVDGFAADGGLHILVNNAVYFNYAPLVDMPEDVVDRMLNIGLKGAFWATAAATPHIAKSGGGSIINLSSIALSVGIPTAAVYTAIKGALDAFTRQQAIELGPSGIRVNALAPGTVVTPGASTVISPEGYEQRKSLSPLGRLATDMEIGAAAVFLASDEAASISGITIKIDAAQTISGVK